MHAKYLLIFRNYVLSVSSQRKYNFYHQNMLLDAFRTNSRNIIGRNPSNMYADDTSISFSSNSIPDINQKVNSDLLCLKTWMESNKLSLNVTKTKTILIGGRKKLKGIENSGPQNLQIAIDQELF